MKKTIIINTTEQTIPTFFTEAQDYLQKFDIEPICPVCQKPLELHIRQNKEAHKLVVLAHLQCPDEHISVCITRRENEQVVISFPSESQLQTSISNLTDKYHFDTWAKNISLKPCPKCSHGELKLARKKHENDGSGFYQSILIKCPNCKHVLKDAPLTHGGPIPLSQDDVDVLYRVGAIRTKVEEIIAESIIENDEAKNVIAALPNLRLLYGYSGKKAAQKALAEKLWIGLSPFIVGAFAFHEQQKQITDAFAKHFKP